MFCALYDGDMFAKLDGKVCFVFQNVPQPWHPQTVYLHEVSLLVKKHSPAAFAKFVRAVYKEFAGGFGRFFDEDTYEKSRKEIYAELVELAGGVGADKEKIAADLKLMKLVLVSEALLHLAADGARHHVGRHAVVRLVQLVERVDRVLVGHRPLVEAVRAVEVAGAVLVDPPRAEEVLRPRALERLVGHRLIGRMDGASERIASERIASARGLRQRELRSRIARRTALQNAHHSAPG